MVVCHVGHCGGSFIGGSRFGVVDVLCGGMQIRVYGEWEDNIDTVKNKEGAGGINKCVDFRCYYSLISFFLSPSSAFEMSSAGYGSG